MSTVNEEDQLSPDETESNGSESSGNGSNANQSGQNSKGRTPKLRSSGAKQKPTGGAEGFREAMQSRANAKKASKIPTADARTQPENQPGGGKIPGSGSAGTDLRNSSELQDLGPKTRREKAFNAAVNNMPRNMEDLKSLGKQALKQAGKQLYQKARRQIAIWAAEALSATVSAIGWPVIIAVIIIILFILLIFIILGADASARHYQQEQNQQNPLQISKTGPTTATAGQVLVYTITVSYTQQAQDIQVSDAIPQYTKYQSSSWKDTVKNNTVTWSVAENTPGKPKTIGPIADDTFTLTLVSTSNNKRIVNQAIANVIGPVAGGGGGAGADNENYVAPNTNTCNGEWSGQYPISQNPMKKNFGDPSCNFSKDALYSLIQKLDPKSVHAWFDVIAPGESSDDPNAWAPAVTAIGWGLYALLGSQPYGQPANVPAMDTSPPNPLERGDLNWQIQTANAINFNIKDDNCNFQKYWQTAQKANLPPSC
jgi:uncharacterized repeat protein (TIGR01451 family)